MVLVIAKFPVLRYMVLITVVYDLMGDILMVHRFMDSNVFYSFLDLVQIVILRYMLYNRIFVQVTMLFEIVMSRLLFA